MVVRAAAWSMLWWQALLLAGTMAVPLVHQAPPASFSQVFCSEYPWLCGDKIDCRNSAGEAPSTEEVMQEKLRLWHQVVETPGQPNERSWCFANPIYWDLVVKECVAKGDLKTSAQVQFRYSVLNHPLDELDASYCFLWGHCQNEEVTSRTTREEAIEMCNQIFPEPNSWQSVGFSAAPTNISMVVSPRHVDSYTHFNTSDQVESFVKLACAQGNYHCDVVYCKETYCQTEYYRQKYQHLSPKPR
ncbi:unnamed protein product [Symbiodinium necroappetens]|uniref:Uncharacterized protein n=1 Tax=Symbiodinium necroappetens TaxID=1628268 RepID=A0A812LBV8_9DINO|nr:unnamed protein product [Symbiodinium necroappetens]|mmetsp:Transcript_93823/g.223071  ORF Transcript_93823/g.223071 Transcript_93823/m.223071 type:complete len:245 (+) Transcript_93823:58-792(+)